MRCSVSAAVALVLGLAGALPIAACSSSKTTPPVTGTGADASAETSTPGEDTTVATFDKTPIYFTGTENKRTVDMSTSFPATGTYTKITLHLALDCPSNKCDAWDRFGTLGVALPDVDGGDGGAIELARFMTPYGVKGAWDFDVTDLRPLLKGDLTLRAFIDTWVGPGSSSGNGWLLTASFEMTGGTPTPEPIAAVPIWIRHEIPYGDPAHPSTESTPAQTIALPAGATALSVRSFITGHGQGNGDNCAEFCPREHAISVGDVRTPLRVWRNDCKTSTVPNQKGNVTPSRAGWCPGASVNPWILDASAALQPGQTEVTVAYDVQAYENTCRPDAATCADCTLGTTCAYDGGNHTAPFHSVSSILIAYR